MSGYECVTCNTKISASYLADHLIKNHLADFFTEVIYRPNGIVSITYYVCKKCKSTVELNYMAKHTLIVHFSRIYRTLETPETHRTLMDFAFQGEIN